MATLATLGERGPHVVPVTFAASGDRIVSAVDAKPKSTTRLARLENIQRRPEVALLVHGYHEDWSRLWWVRADGRASVTGDPGPLGDALVERYDAYRRARPDGPFVVVEVDRWSGWRAG